MRRNRRGFTLIEVMVALAVAGGTLVLVLSANAASLRRSAEAGHRARLERAAEGKLAEWCAGIETAREGALAGFDGHRWEIREEADRAGGLKRLRRVTLVVRGDAVLERSILLHGPPGVR